jgi:prophage regulatory protein
MILPVQHLVGSQEIGVMLKVGRQRVQQLISRADFPEPEVTLAMGKVWRTADVEAWALSHGRTIAEDDSAE